MMFARGGMMGLGNFGGAHCLGGNYGYFGGPMMMLLGFIILALIAYAIYKISTKNSLGIYKSNDSANEALEVLKMKFVNGEINEEEYLRKRSLLLK